MSDSAPVRRRRPESEATRLRRLHALDVALADREHQAREALAMIRGAPPRDRAHVKPLGQIEDDEQRLAVYRARVERLEAMLDQTQRKRLTRATIVTGRTILAELARDPDDPLLARLMAIVDQGVHRPRDRLAIAETLGLAITPIRERAVPDLPDFDALTEQRLARETPGGEPAPRIRRRKKGGQSPLP
jgi:hypothetical protein